MSFACVILAAGAGRRAGGCKPLMDLCGKAVVDRVIEAAQAVASMIVVVGGCRFDELRSHLEAQRSGVTLIDNDAWQSGMFSSVQAGLAAARAPVFVHPADVPGVGPEVYRALASAWDADPRPVLRPLFAGRRGHPVLLGPEAVAAVRDAPAASNLRDVLAPLRSRDVTVEDPMVLRDFDTIDDLETLRTIVGSSDRPGG